MKLEFNFFKRCLAVGYVLTAISSSAFANAWTVKKPSWSPQDEKNFQSFVSAIGEAAASKKCRNTDACLKSSANPYRQSDPQDIKFYSDCADLPYYLRAYFAWKNQLPFTYASQVVPAGTSRDTRYSAEGNLAKKRNLIVSGQDGFQFLKTVIPNSISSAAFRMEYDILPEFESPDFYSAALNREAIVPGTSLYDPTGHVAVVYKVSDDGRVHYIDAHPDNSITSGIYSPKFVRSHPRHGAGFKNWRPFQIINPRHNSAGAIISGQVQMARNSQLPHFEIEQFVGTQPDNSSWKNGKFIFQGQEVNYYDYVRLSLAKGSLVIEPVQDFKEILEDICVAIQDRVIAVQHSIESGISAKPHPARLPLNIYGTEGEWETFSTPSRDARLKTSFVDLMQQTRSYFEKIERRDPSIQYKGIDLKADLRNAYLNFVPTCTIQYQKTNGQAVTLNFDDIRRRLFDLSFSPYHCSELRWGATGEELQSCQDNENKRLWYSRQRWLRNQTERNYDARMDFTLDQLTGPKPGAGVLSPPNVDVLGFLN